MNPASNVKKEVMMMMMIIALASVSSTFFVRDFVVFFSSLCTAHTILPYAFVHVCSYLCSSHSLSLSFSVCFLLIVSQISIKHTLNKTDSKVRDRENNITQDYNKYKTKLKYF